MIECLEAFPTFYISLTCISQVTECEIFLSLLVKFLDPERPPWQRTLVLEVLTRLCSHPALVRSVPSQVHNSVVKCHVSPSCMKSAVAQG